MIKVFIIDDHKIVIDGIQLMLDSDEKIEFAGFALDGKSGIAQVKSIKPDVVLLDISMPEMTGIEVSKILKQEYPQAKIIALSMHQESSMIKMMLQNDVKGYVLKSAGKQEIIKAIEDVYHGKTYLGETVNEIIIQSFQNRSQKKTTSPFPTLSRREKEILKLILEEFTTQEIANKLFIGFGTVETHRRNMLIKTGARNTAGLVKIAIEYNLLDESGNKT